MDRVEGASAPGNPADSGGELPGWRRTAGLQAISGFVAAVTAAGGPDFLPPEERVAVFDNDGTLWCEKPMPIQLDFILRRLLVMAREDPGLRERQPWKAAYTADYQWLSAAIAKHYQGDDSELKVLAAGVLQAHAGIEVEAFEAQAGAFLRGTRHPTLDRPYLACSYRPMVELLAYLKANGFRNYIASGGGRDFMRPVSEELYGVPREGVIGSSTALAYQDGPSGGTIIRQPRPVFLDDGPGKPVGIWERIGRRPVLAAGNSNGDIQMLRFTGRPGRRSLRLLIRHDDPVREFDYVAGSEAALTLAREQDWTVVSISRDWDAVF